jgi:hypothetical protein
MFDPPPFQFPHPHGTIPVTKIWKIFNTLQSSLIETQQEVKQLGANVATINTTM